MSFWFRSLRTIAYWRHALFSFEALSKVLAIAGVMYLFIEMLDFFRVWTRDKYSAWVFPIILCVSAILVVIYRRPLTRVVYKIPKKDLAVEVRIADLFEADAAIVVSTSKTFDTAPPLIASESLQGQVSLRFFQGNTSEIDKQLQGQLKGKKFKKVDRPAGKTRSYAIGTVATIAAANKDFYFVAMSEFNEEGNAYSSTQMIDSALEGLWIHARDRGELRDLAIPVMGTGRGRIQLPRKKMIERIAQSFVNASIDGMFAHKLIIVVRPSDAERFQVNLFEIRDYLSQSLHV